MHGPMNVKRTYLRTQTYTSYDARYVIYVGIRYDKVNVTL